MHNEPGSSSRGGQPTNVDAQGQVVLRRDVETPSGELKVEEDDEKNQLSTCSRTAFRGNHSAETQLSRHNFLSHRCCFREDESPLDSSRETCVRNSQLRYFFLFLPAKQLRHSMRATWSLLVDSGLRLHHPGLVLVWR